MVDYGSVFTAESNQSILSFALNSIEQRNPGYLDKLWSTLNQGVVTMIHDELEAHGIPLAKLEGGELKLTIKFRKFSEEEHHCEKCSKCRGKE